MITDPASLVDPRRSRLRRAHVALPSALVLVGCGLLGSAGELGHTAIHTVVHGTVTTQLSSAGVSHPEPVAEAFEYFALGEQARAREFLTTACAENSPDQLRSAVHVLQQVAPSLGSYAHSVQSFVGMLSCTDSPPPAATAATESTPATVATDQRAPAMGVASQCQENLGLEMESCTGSPQCSAGLGCQGGVCRVRAGATATQTPTAASDPFAAPPAPMSAPQGSGGATAPGLPATVSSAQIEAVLSPAITRVRRCANDLTGLVPLTIDVDGEGTVERAYAGDAALDPAVAACIQRIVVGLTFPRSQSHQRFTFNLNLGPVRRAAHGRRH